MKEKDDREKRWCWLKSYTRVARWGRAVHSETAAMPKPSSASAADWPARGTGHLNTEPTRARFSSTWRCSYTVSARLCTGGIGGFSASWFWDVFDVRLVFRWFPPLFERLIHPHNQIVLNLVRLFPHLTGEKVNSLSWFGLVLWSRTMYARAHIALTVSVSTIVEKNTSCSQNFYAYLHNYTRLTAWQIKVCLHIWYHWLESLQRSRCQLHFQDLH